MVAIRKTKEGRVPEITAGALQCPAFVSRLEEPKRVLLKVNVCQIYGFLRNKKDYDYFTK